MLISATLRSLAAAALMSTLIVGCDDQTPAGAGGPPLPPSFKGYELYSWSQGGVSDRADADGWCFTLIAGTNRGKLRSEIGPPDSEPAAALVEVSVCGGRAFEATLARVPAGEAVVWSDGRLLADDAPALPRLELPPASVVHRIERRAAQLRLELTVQR
jgi:hypothetical protein